jgi:threonine dehydrogenase-like Zn-dependent dehydrogenase
MSLAKAIGATCIVADTVVDYLSLAKRVGADYTIDITTEDIEERVKAISGEMGPNVIVDCKGIPDFLNNAVNMVSFAGRIVCVRYCEKNQEYNTLWCSAKELSIIGLSRFNNEFRLVVKKLRNHLNVIRKLTADRFKFEHYQLALKRAVDEDPKSMKVLVDFD